jgi:hypothetical protein
MGVFISPLTSSFIYLSMNLDEGRNLARIYRTVVSRGRAKLRLVANELNRYL